MDVVHAKRNKYTNEILCQTLIYATKEGRVGIQELSYLFYVEQSLPLSRLGHINRATGMREVAQQEWSRICRAYHFVLWQVVTSHSRHPRIQDLLRELTSVQVRGVDGGCPAYSMRAACCLTPWPMVTRVETLP